MASLTQADFIKEIAVFTGLPQIAVKNVLDAAAGFTEEFLAQGVTVPLPGIGKLAVKGRPGREGRNPATGETINIPPRTVVKFTPTKALRDLGKNED
jgi:DNA-binding protein HU-beta